MSNLKLSKYLKILLYHIIAFIVILFTIFVYKCPFYYLFNFPCPGCGITRAHFALLRFDFKQAFDYHPLFFTAIPIILYVPHRNVLKKKLSIKSEIIAIIVLSVLFLFVYLFRIYNKSIFDLIL